MSDRDYDLTWSNGNPFREEMANKPVPPQPERDGRSAPVLKNGEPIFPLNEPKSPDQRSAAHQPPRQGAAVDLTQSPTKSPVIMGMGTPRPPAAPQPDIKPEAQAHEVTPLFFQGESPAQANFRMAVRIDQMLTEARLRSPPGATPTLRFSSISITPMVQEDGQSIVYQATCIATYAPDDQKVINHSI